MSGSGPNPPVAYALEAPRPWAKWEKGPVPREWEGERRLQVYGRRGYLKHVEVTWQNGWYAVMIAPMDTPIGEVLHLMVVNLPNTVVRSWRDLQRIKNELCGLDRVAFEVFPHRDDVVDQADMTHLWVMPKGYVLPFGLQKYVGNDEPIVEVRR